MKKVLIAAIALLFSVTALTSCRDTKDKAKDATEEAAKSLEEAGEDLKDAADDAAKALEKAGEDAKEMGEKALDSIKKAGEDLKEAGEEMKESANNLHCVKVLSWTIALLRLAISDPRNAISHPSCPTTTP